MKRVTETNALKNRILQWPSTVIKDKHDKLHHQRSWLELAFLIQKHYIHIPNLEYKSCIAYKDNYLVSRI